MVDMVAKTTVGMMMAITTVMVEMVAMIAVGMVDTTTVGTVVIITINVRSKWTW